MIHGALRMWQGPPPAPACLAPSACRSRHPRQAPKKIGHWQPCYCTAKEHRVMYSRQNTTRACDNFASMRKLLATHQRSIAHVAGAPACPCLPGGQRPPQQAPSPGSKEDMKRGALLRHSKGTLRHALHAKQHRVTLFTSLRCESHLPRSNVALRLWQGPPPAPACLAPSACRSRHARQAPEMI